MMSLLCGSSGLLILICLQNMPDFVRKSNFSVAELAPRIKIYLSFILLMKLQSDSEGRDCIRLLLSLLQSSSRLSMKIIEGTFSSAASKTFLIFSSESPDRKSQELTEKALSFLVYSLLRYERMQFAKKVLPEPGEPEIKNPRLGETRLTALYNYSFSMRLKSSDFTWLQTSYIPPRFLKLQASLSWNSMINSFFFVFLAGFCQQASMSIIDLTFSSCCLEAIVLELKQASTPDLTLSLGSLNLFSVTMRSTILSWSISGFLAMSSRITFLSSELIVISLPELLCLIWMAYLLIFIMLESYNNHIWQANQPITLPLYHQISYHHSYHLALLLVEEIPVIKSILYVDLLSGWDVLRRRQKHLLLADNRYLGIVMCACNMWKATLLAIEIVDLIVFVALRLPSYDIVDS